jgi:SAM-dependent methyltransferase
MKEYWNSRFSKEEKIWGVLPSKTAYIALKLFQKNNIKKVLIPGIGYGRNSKLFSDNDFQVVGIEISEIAYEMAKLFDPKSKIILGSILDMPLNDELFDAIYCYNTLHLFLKRERTFILKNCYESLKKGGFVFFAVFSDKEKSYGEGKKIEENTFESKPGRPVHYFSKNDLIHHFKDNFRIIKNKITVDKEIHGAEGLHYHKLRYIFAQKIEIR